MILSRPELGEGAGICAYPVVSDMDAVRAVMVDGVTFAWYRINQENPIRVY